MKKYRLLLLMIFLAFCFLLIPISYSKYFSTVRNTLRINIYDPQKAYFKEFDGSNGELFGFTKSTIEHFSRNTTLSKNEVLGKSGVQLISSVSNDAYRSTDEIYGWVENNTFYWWSEAETVYFHPNTLAPFKEMSNVLTIDLTGTDTSDVCNFSHVPEKIDYMLKYTSDDDDAKYNNAEEVYTDLLDAPLAIADSSAIVELSAELKERILDETVPQAEHIKKVIAERAANAREAVESAYGAKMSDIREKRKTVLSIREKEAERERKYKEEQRRRQEQEKKWMQKESERLKMVDPSFDKVFPKKR